MKIIETPIDGLTVVETEAFSDHRGAFSRLYCQKELKEIIGKRQIVQMNQSCTRTVGAIRGLHYQNPPYAEMKLVRCLRGEVWDVAVDLRADSPTFLKWHAVNLTPENALMFAIPEGFAHGFQVLKPDSELLYLHTEYYTQEAEGGFPYNDPTLAIDWQLPVQDISARDQQHEPISPHFSGINI